MRCSRMDGGGNVVVMVGGTGSTGEEAPLAVLSDDGEGRGSKVQAGKADGMFLEPAASGHPLGGQGWVIC